MVCTDLTPGGAVRDLIYCYANQCRSVVLDGFLRSLGTDPLRCTDDNTRLNSRAVSDAMLAVDMQPASGEARLMQFCYATGSRDRFLTHVQETR
jgi:hypothetical protein